jgi:paired amphipathic helix protein Sin3a
MYDNLMKPLNMFTRDIINLRALVACTEKILADDRVSNVDFRPPGSIRTGPHDATLPCPIDDAQSPSYHQLPESVSFPM